MKKWFLDSRDTFLSNGLRVISIKRDTQIFSVHGGINIGSLYEKDSEKGICHFIEHMLFKGTESKSNEELNNELELLGGEYNAYTDYSCTVYSISALSEELPRGLELLSDMIINSNFDSNEFERERGVILAELRTNKDDVEDYSFNKTYEAAFNKSPLKYDVGGTEKHVESFSKEDLVSFYKKHYIPNNSCITIVSNYEHNDIIKLVKKYFSNWKKGELELRNAPTEDNIPGKFVSYKSDIEQSTLIYLYTLHNISREEELPLKILSLRLGESSNSILFRELREKRGLAYDVYTNMDLTKNVKTFVIYTAISDENLDETTEVIDKCIEDIKNRNIIFDKNTVELMKKVHKTAVASIMEDSTDLCNYVMHQALEDEPINEFINDMEELENLTEEHVYNVAKKVLNNSTVHILKSDEEDDEEEEE